MKPMRFIIGMMFFQLIVHTLRGYEVLPLALFVLLSSLVVMWGEWKESCDG
jgi:hypothetical protein